MNCLITGASIGIGHDTVLKIASLNYNIYFTYLNNFNKAKKLQEEVIDKYNVKCYIKKCDLSKESNIKDVIISSILSVIVILLYIISYNKIFAITFDEKFAKSIGIKTNFYNMLFASLCSVVVVLGMRLMGSLLISSLIIFPTITSMQMFKRFKSVVISSVVISLISFVIGLLVSYYNSTPAGATIVLVHLFMFLIFKLVSYIKN